MESKKKPKIHHTTHARKTSVKEQSKEIEEGLRSIYGGEPEDLHVVERGGSALTYWLWRIIGVLGVFALAVLVSVVLISRGALAGKDYDPLVMSLVMPSEVKSGEVVTIEIPYENPKKIPIASLEFDLNLPASFKVISSVPAPTDPDEMIYTLGNLGPRSDGVVKLQGLWLESAPSSTNIQAIANYRPSNFNADFSKISSSPVTTTSSVLVQEVTGPETVSPGEIVTYTVKINHNGEVPLSDVEALVSLPQGFILGSSVPALEVGAAPLFKLGTFEPKTEKIISLKGSFSSEVTDVQQITSVVRIALSSTRTLTQVSNEWLTNVKGGDARLSLVANGITGDVAAEPGSTLRLSFRLENAGTVEMKDASVLLDFQPPSGIPIIWSESSLDGGVLTADGVKFDALKIGTILPGEKKTFNLAFPLKETLAATDVDTFTAVARATTASSTLLSSPITVKMNAGVDFDISAHYYSSDGAVIAEGPMPPKVGETTTYELMWTVGHALHALEDMVVTATLPEGVGFAGNTASDSGAITYDEATRTVRWQVDTLAVETGDIHAKFFVSVTPADSDEGTFVKMLSSSTLRITDEKTGARIDRTADAVTTELPDDSFAAGKGTVEN